MALEHIDPKKLLSLQKENYNFHKVAGLLADYGFNCIRLTNDWHGADFLAVHIDGKTVLKVQQKASAVIVKKFQGKGIHMAFPMKGQWYLVPHRRLFAIVRKEWCRCSPSRRCSPAAPKGCPYIHEKKEWKKRGKLRLKEPRWLREKLKHYKLRGLCP